MPENSISYPISADDEKVVVDEVDGSRRKFEDSSVGDGYIKNKATVEPLDSPSMSQPSPQPAPGASASPARTDRPRRLEDVFQDVIIKAFVKFDDFKKFAKSRYGLRLSNYDAETICQDNNSVEEKKIQMLNKWKLKMGKNATPEKILQILEDYLKKMNEEDD